MSNLIDSSYFSGKLSLPETIDAVGLSIVNKFIVIYEPEFIQKALGYKLWKAYTTGIGETTPDQIWKDIRDGVEFDYGTNRYKWIGFANSDKRSPIANYVYYMFMEDKATDNNLVGVTIPATTNATRTDPVKKMCDAWNEMVGMINVLKLYLNQNSSIYTDWNFNNSHVYKKVNLLGI